MPGNRYEITSAGDTDFTTVGASASSVGEVFVATAAGSGSGEATYLGRNATAEFEVIFDIHRLPTLDFTDTTVSATAGVAADLPVISVSDWDSDSVTVTFVPALPGVISIESDATFSLIENADGSFSLSGEIDQIQDALSNVQFTAENDTGNGTTSVSVSVDDSDQTHTDESSPISITLDVENATPVLSQAFRLNLREAVYSQLTGLEFSDTDSEL